VTLVEGCHLFSRRRLCGLTYRVAGDTVILPDGLSVYQSLSQGHNLHPVILGCGQRAVESFPDFHQVIARLKTWIWGLIHMYLKNTPTAIYLNSSVVLIAALSSAV